MLKDQSEDPELAADCCANEQQDETDAGRTQFRVSLWLSIAADIRRERLSREMKGHGSC